MDFDGKVLFATGAGSGIAVATARRFASSGGRVAIVDLDADKAKEIAADIEGAIGIGADVSDEASVRAAVDATLDELGSIDCVLNAAGHAAFGPIEEWSLEAWNRMMSVHAGGTFLVCKQVLPLMRAQGGGSIVNIASTAALRPTTTTRRMARRRVPSSRSPGSWRAKVLPTCGSTPLPRAGCARG